MVNTTVEKVKEANRQVVHDNQRKRSSKTPLSGSLGWDRVKSEREEPMKIKSHLGNLGFLFWEGVYFFYRGMYLCLFF